MKINIPTTIEREYPSPAFFRSKSGNKHIRAYEREGELFCDTIYMTDSYCSYGSNCSLCATDIVDAVEVSEEEYKSYWVIFRERMVKDLQHG
jgi:hypothetical protein